MTLPAAATLQPDRVDRYERMLQPICRSLGTYTYLDVSQALRDAPRQGRSKRKQLPSDPEIAQIIARAPWSVAGEIVHAKRPYRKSKRRSVRLCMQYTYREPAKPVDQRGAQLPATCDLF